MFLFYILYYGIRDDLAYILFYFYYGVWPYIFCVFVSLRYISLLFSNSASVCLLNSWLVLYLWTGYSFTIRDSVCVLHQQWRRKQHMNRKPGTRQSRFLHLKAKIWLLFPWINKIRFSIVLMRTAAYSISNGGEVKYNRGRLQTGDARNTTPKAKNQLLTRTTHIARTDWSDVKMFDIVLITAKTMSACMLRPRRHPRPANHVITTIYPHASYGSEMSSSNDWKAHFRCFYHATLLQSVQYDVWQLSVTPVHRVETAEVTGRSSDFSQRLAAGIWERKNGTKEWIPLSNAPDHRSPI